MPWKITNSTNDPRKAMLRRRAAKMTTEPLICGRLLRVRDSMVISDQAYEANKLSIERYVQQGVITAERMGGQKQQAAPPPKPEPKKEEPPQDTTFSEEVTPLDRPAPVQEEQTSWQEETFQEESGEEDTEETKSESGKSGKRKRRKKN